MLPFKRSLLGIFVPLLSVTFLAPSVFAQADNDESDAPKADSRQETPIEEIIVTAAGREQLATEIPMNITAMSEAELRRKNIRDLKDVLADSVSISAPVNSNRHADSVTVRGLNVARSDANDLERFVKSTVAYYLDDTPLPNIGFRVKDIARVETLLGPQGTLYGGGSLGGTIRYITNQPELGATYAEANASVYSISGADLSYDADFVANLPLSDTFAARGSLAYLDQAGWVTRHANPIHFFDQGLERVPNPNPNQETYDDDNWEEATTVKVALLWELSDDAAVTYTYMYQDQTAHGTDGSSRQTVAYACEQEGLVGAECDAAYIDQTTPLQYGTDHLVSTYEEWADREITLNSLNLKWDLEFASLNSTTSFYKDTRDGQSDYLSQGSIYYGWIPGLALSETTTSAYILPLSEYEGLVHETRLTSNTDGPLSWIVGLYYTDQETAIQFSEFVPGFDAVVEDTPWLDNRETFADVRLGSLDEGYYDRLGSTYKETAIFGELMYAVSDRFNLTFGARFFSYKDKANPSIVDYAGITKVSPESDSDDTDQVFKFNADYRLTDDLLVYGTYSQGFRRGGSNGFRATENDVLELDPEANLYEPDTTNNLELGLKGSLTEDLYIQADIYQIEWKDVQTYNSQTIDLFFPINGTENGPDGISKGYEFALHYNLTDSFHVNYAMSYNEAKWDGTKEVCIYLPDPNFPDADRQCRTWSEGGILGGSPEWRHNFGVGYDREFDSGLLSVNLDGRYVGETPVDRTDAEGESVYRRDSYTLYYASASYLMDLWRATLWIDNLTDERAEVSGQGLTGSVTGYRTIYAQPRTVGVNLTYTFE